jgi:hypothetical protein
MTGCAHVSRLLLGISLAFFIFVGIGRPAVAASRKIHVVVIGVPHWSIDSYNEGSLGSSISYACDKVHTFFASRFEKEQLEFHIQCEPTNTDWASIYKLLYVDVPKFGQQTLTFVFILSHGERVPDDPARKAVDLRILTSDTTAETRDERSISVVHHLIPWLSKLTEGPEGSTVLVFLDTCHAGSAATVLPKLEGLLDEERGLKLSIIGSSLAASNSYAASFTLGLLDLWSLPECPPANKTNEVLRAAMQQKALATFTGLEGYPTPIIPYSGTLCIGNLGADGKLLFAYQGSLKNVLWEAVPIVGGYPAANALARISPSEAPFGVMRLDSGNYEVRATVESGDIFKTTADLTTKATQAIWLEWPKTTTELFGNLDRWARLARASGVTSEEVAPILQMSRWIQLSQTQLSDTLVLNNLGTLAVTIQTQDPNAVGDPKRALNTVVDTAASTLEVAADFGERLAFAGDSRRALALVREALERATAAPSDAASQAAAQRLYFVAGLVGDAKAATQIRNRFSIELGDRSGDWSNLELSALTDPMALASLKAAAGVSLIRQQE